MNMALRHLLWKDTRMIAALAAVILVGTLTFHLLLWITMLIVGYHSEINFAVPLWILMPNLMALGAPPMLVGSEEESGTLGWIRSLPVPWPMVVISKSLVAVAAVTLSWAASSLLLWMTLAIWKEPLTSPVWTMLRSDEVLGLAFFTFQLLFTGFFLAYLCRSPIRSLILVLPTMIGLFCALHFVKWLLGILPDPLGLWWAAKILIAIAYMALLVLSQFSPASWRLARRPSRKSTSPPPEFTVRAPQPYALNSLASATRPGKWRVLLWQAWRQQSPPLTGLTFIAACVVAFWVLISYRWSLQVGFSRDFMKPIGAMVLVLLCTWIGCLCFYPDSILRRHFFFADRGFATRYVWLSRIAAPAFAMILVLIMSMWIPLDSEQFAAGLLGSCTLGFACGLLSSMWMTRSTLSFFLGPMLVLVIWVVLIPFILHYDEYFGYIAVAALPLLIVSWKLTGQWSKRTQDWRTQIRIAGYVLLAIVSIPVAVFAARFTTTPRSMPQWRAKMFAQPLPDAFTDLYPYYGPSEQGYLRPWLETHPLPIEVGGRTIDDPRLLRLVTERSLHTHSNDPQGTIDAVRSAQRMFEWSKAARLALLEGKMNPVDMLRFADDDEFVAIMQLNNLVMSDVHPVPSEAAGAIRDALNAMASEELREKSWRMALAMEWRIYQIRGGSRRFAGSSVDDGYWLPVLEGLRADRNVDWALHSLLDTPMPDVPDPYVWSPDPRMYGHSPSFIDFHVGYGPKYRAEIEQKLKQRGF